MIALKDSLGTEFVERIRTIFSANGLLSKTKNFEFRPEQQEMAVAVAQALEEERHLVVEAGTGVGKSLAYLIPSIVFALEKKQKAIISTQTINLQEQLVHKDIPILKKILPLEFEAALMKGRQTTCVHGGSSGPCSRRTNSLPGRSRTSCSRLPRGLRNA